MANESFLPEGKLWTKWRTLEANFLKHVLAKTETMQRINTPSVFNLKQVNKIIAEDVNRAGEF